MDYQTLRFGHADGLGRLTLSRPERGNRIDGRFLVELEDVCGRVGGDDSIVTLLLAAEGVDFCLGWEEATLDKLTRAAGKPGAAIDLFGCLAALRQPVVAAIQGRAVSAGLELALACDIRLADPSARFSLPEVGQGRMPFTGGTQRLPRTVGRSTALAMLLCATELGAEAALQRGLVSQVYEAGRLAEESEALAQTIANRGPIALSYAKEAVQAGLELSLDQALRYEAGLSVLLQATRDRSEGVRAFLEKRAPHFEGN